MHPLEFIVLTIVPQVKFKKNAAMRENGGRDGHGCFSD